MDLVKSEGVKFETTGLRLTRRMEMAEAERFVNSLDALETGFNWWIGDLLNTLEHLHGEVYAQLVPESKATSWLVYKWVCSRVKAPIRRPKLTFSHHQLVASLLHERQEIFLKKAEEEHLLVSDLRKLIKQEKGKTVKSPNMLPVVCPACGAEFEVQK